MAREFLSYDRNLKLIEANSVKKTFIPAPTGGLIVDAEVRVAIDSIRQLLIDLQLMKES